MEYDKVIAFAIIRRFKMAKYSKNDIIRIVDEEDIEFIRLQFTDIFGTLKNVAITASQLEKALDNKCMFDGSSIEGFVRIEESDMYLHPDLDTFMIFHGDHSRARSHESSVMSIWRMVHRLRETRAIY